MEEMADVDDDPIELSDSGDESDLDLTASGRGRKRKRDEGVPAITLDGCTMPPEMWDRVFRHLTTWFTRPPKASLVALAEHPSTRLLMHDYLRYRTGWTWPEMRERLRTRRIRNSLLAAVLNRGTAKVTSTFGQTYLASSPNLVAGTYMSSDLFMTADKDPEMGEHNCISTTTSRGAGASYVVHAPSGWIRIAIRLKYWRCADFVKILPKSKEAIRDINYQLPYGLRIIANTKGWGSIDLTIPTRPPPVGKGKKRRVVRTERVDPYIGSYKQTVVFHFQLRKVCYVPSWRPCEAPEYR